MIPKVLTTEEACKVLRMGRTKLNTIMRTDPTFPAVKDGRWYVFGDQLEKWLMSKKGKMN